MKNRFFAAYCLISLFALVHVSAQNLLHNPEIKEHRKPATDFNTIALAHYWSSATNGTVDLFSKQSTAEKNGIPANRQGFQTPLGIANYAGIIVYWEPSEKKGYCEYLQGELMKPLVAGKTYLVRFHVSLSDKSTRYVKGLAAFVSDSKIEESGSTYLALKPQVVHQEFVSDTSNWVEISGQIKAKGGEQYIVIGLFANTFPSGTFSKSVGKTTFNKENRAYYYVTGVSVEEYTEPDSDKDGIADSKDLCPTEIGEAKFEGCPDTDKDGIADKDDDCPTVAGITAFFGCVDSDDDAVGDNKDACPTEKGELNGCPDSDKDGVADKEDKCPDATGLASNKGCPEVKAEVTKIFQQALQGIQFETGKEVIKPVSFKILNQVAEVMKSNPVYLLKIEGHTDDVGDNNKNLDLSQKRADAVKAYLEKKGVTGQRTSAVGYGETVPVADNATKDGKAKNRRVEFTVKF